MPEKALSGGTVSSTERSWARPSMRVAIIQSCYIPWKGFFDLIGRADLYVVLDGAQYVKRHWHNRNRIMTPGGPIWLTIPGRHQIALRATDRRGRFRGTMGRQALALDRVGLPQIALLRGGSAGAEGGLRGRRTPRPAHRRQYAVPENIDAAARYLYHRGARQRLLSARHANRKAARHLREDRRHEISIRAFGTRVSGRILVCCGRHRGGMDELRAVSGLSAAQVPPSNTRSP